MQLTTTKNSTNRFTLSNGKYCLENIYIKIFMLVCLFLLIAALVIWIIRKWCNIYELSHEESSQKESKTSETSQITYISENSLKKNSATINHKQAIVNLNIKPSKSNLKISSNTNLQEAKQFDTKRYSFDSDSYFQEKEDSDFDSCSIKYKSCSQMKLDDKIRKSCISSKSVSFNEEKNTIKTIKKNLNQTLKYE